MNRLLKAEISWKKCIFFLVLVAFFLIHSYFLSSKLISSGQSQATSLLPESVLFLLVGGLGFITVCLAAASLFSRASEETLVTAGLIVFGTVYLFLFAPTTVPDEPAHYCSAYYVSNLLCCPLRQLHSDTLLIREVDLRALTNQFNHYQNSGNYAGIFTNFQWFCGAQNLINFDAPNVVSTAPFGYLFSGLGIAAGRLLGLGAYPVFYLGRLCNLIAYTCITRLAIKRTPIGKTVMGVISFFPMTLHEIASFSYDSYAIAFVFLFISNVLYWICADDKMQRRDMLICILLGILASTTKIVYLPFLAAIFFIPASKVAGSRKKGYGILAGMFAACLFFYLMLYLPTSFSSLSRSELSYTEAQSFTLGWVLHHPFATAKIFIRTIFVMGYFYFDTLFGSYLGWFQIFIGPEYMVIFPILLILAAFTAEPQRRKLTGFMQLAMLVLCLGSGMLALASMFFGWTSMDSVVIEGIQGRYFLPILFPLCAFLQTDIIRMDPRRSKYLYSLEFSFAYFCILQIALGSFT